MDIETRLRRARDLTPTEQQIARTIQALGPRIEGLSIKEFARASSASIASIHRFCRKLGLEGYKELKVEVGRALALSRGRESVDIDFPFAAGDGGEVVSGRLELLYERAMRETRELMGPEALDTAARLLLAADVVDIYTQSHNLYPAQMFCDRLLSCGKAATCHRDMERQLRTALASDASHVAIVISYSGNAGNLQTLLPILGEREVPTVLVGTPRAAALHPGLAAYLQISDSESLRTRITQFASHVSVQYALDSLYGTLFALDYEDRLAFLSASLPYTALPGTEKD